MFFRWRIEIDRRIEARHLLKHSFYQRWQNGKLSLDELRGYAKEYYSFEKEFPCFLSAIHSNCDDPEVRWYLLENLRHEEEPRKSHVQLWRAFMLRLGIDPEHIDQHIHNDETENLLSVFRRFARSSKTVLGLASLYAYESQQPEISRQKRNGLKSFYGIQDEKALEFFEEHEKYDVVHADHEFKGIEKLSKHQPEEFSQILVAVDETLEAFNQFLSGVEKKYCVC